MSKPHFGYGPILLQYKKCRKVGKETKKKINGGTDSKYLNMHEIN